MPFKFSSSLKTIQSSSKIFLDELKTNETLDVDRIVDAYRKALLSEKQGYNDLSFGLIKAKRIYSDDQITHAITNRGYDPNNFSSSFQKIKRLPAKHKVGNSLQPRSKQIAKALNRIKNMRRSSGVPEWKEIQPLLQQVYESINGSEYSYVSKLKPKEKD